MNSADIWKDFDPKVMSVMNNTVRPLSTKRELGETFLEGTIEGHTRTQRQDHTCDGNGGGEASIFLDDFCVDF